MSLKKLMFLGLLCLGCNSTVEVERKFKILDPVGDTYRLCGDFPSLSSAELMLWNHGDGAIIVEVPEPVAQENRILRRRQEALNRQWEQERILRGDPSEPSIKMDIEIEEDPYPPGPDEFKPH